MTTQRLSRRIRSRRRGTERITAETQYEREDPTRVERALDGGWPEPSIVVPAPLTSHIQQGIRRGPYEDNYVITHGYDAERTIIEL